jgi:hypothetical protein
MLEQITMYQYVTAITMGLDSGRGNVAGNEMLENCPEIRADCPPIARGKARLLTLEGLDGRTVAARRAAQLAKGFEAELGGTLSATQRLAVEQASALAAIAEDAQARRLAGDMTISLEDLVRATNAATRAVRQLGIKAASAATPPPSLSAWAQQAVPPRPQEDCERDEGDEGVSDASPSEPTSEGS